MIWSFNCFSDCVIVSSKDKGPCAYNTYEFTDTIIFEAFYDGDITEHRKELKKYSKLSFSNYYDGTCYYYYKKFYSSIFNNDSINNLPSNITSLTMGNDFNCEIHTFPQTLTYLEFGYAFNQSFANEFPQTLKYLKFGHNFNKSIKIFPHELEHLEFGYAFNRKITNLPKSLKYLIFGHTFNQQIKIPPNITHLTFGNKFNRKIKIPRKITHLIIGNKFNQPINKLPSTLLYLEINGIHVGDFNKLPEFLKNLEHLNISY